MKLISVFFALSMAISTSAQGEERDKSIRLHAAEKISQINDYMSFMVNKKKTLEARQYYMNKALDLFIGKGNSYEENGVEKEGVLIHIKSKNGKVARNMPLKKFFHSLAKGFRSCSNIKIESIEIGIIKVSELRQVDTDLWVGTCLIDQAYDGVRDGRNVYHDITAKRVKCNITKADIEDNVENIILYGDVYAIETR